MIGNESSNTSILMASWLPISHLRLNLLSSQCISVLEIWTGPYGRTGIIRNRSSFWFRVSEGWSCGRKKDNLLLYFVWETRKDKSVESRDWDGERKRWRLRSKCWEEKQKTRRSYQIWIAWEKRDSENKLAFSLFV